MSQPFTPADYVTAHGHQLAIGDEVTVTTPCRFDSFGAVVVELLPRSAGEVPNVRLRNHDRRTLVVNAFCVEPDWHTCRWVHDHFTCRTDRPVHV